MVSLETPEEIRRDIERLKETPEPGGRRGRDEPSPIVLSDGTVTWAVEAFNLVTKKSYGVTIHYEKPGHLIIGATAFPRPGMIALRAILDELLDE